MPTSPSAAQRLARLEEIAEGLFTALADLRLTDARRKGRDSDVHYGQCHALANLGLIDAPRVQALDQQVADAALTYFANTPTTEGAAHG